VAAGTSGAAQFRAAPDIVQAANNGKKLPAFVTRNIYKGEEQWQR
jgi:hypothetical protein